MVATSHTDGVKDDVFSGPFDANPRTGYIQILCWNRSVTIAEVFVLEQLGNNFSTFRKSGRVLNVEQIPFDFPGEITNKLFNLKRILGDCIFWLPLLVIVFFTFYSRKLKWCFIRFFIITIGMSIVLLVMFTFSYSSHKIFPTAITK